MDSFRHQVAKDLGHLAQEALLTQRNVMSWGITTDDDFDALLREVQKLQGAATDLRDSIVREKRALANV